MSPYAEVEHTADWALHVWAPTIEELFVDAARGMYHLAGAEPRLAGTLPTGSAPEDGRRVVNVTGPDYEALLVVWLQELLYYTESEGWVFDDYHIEQLTSTQLRAEVAGRPGQLLNRVIKAVTYHNLAIRPAEAGYETTIVFDV